MLRLFAFTAASINAFVFCTEANPGHYSAVYKRGQLWTHHALTPERVPNDLVPVRYAEIEGKGVSAYLNRVVYGQGTEILEPIANYDEARSRYANLKIEKLYQLIGRIGAIMQDAPPEINERYQEAQRAIEQEIDKLRETESKVVIQYLSRLNRGITTA